MSLVDAQVRWAVPRVLENTIKEFGEKEVPIERFNGLATILHRNMALTQVSTGDQFHALVYVAIAETAEALLPIAAMLYPKDGRSAGPRQ